MRLDFNVLWVEDQPDAVESQRVSIEDRLRKQGFKLRVEFAKTVDDAIEFLSDRIYGDHIDLILMDYQLGPGRKGDEGLREVRLILPYKDIIFYSAESIADLERKIKEQFVQGVWITNRESLPDEVEGVFTNLVHKVLDIDHSRGIVMGATSDIDQKIMNVLCAMFDGCSVEEKSSIIIDVEKRIAKKKETHLNEFGKMKGITHVSELKEYHLVYTSVDRLRLLQEMLSIRGIDTEVVEAFVNYDQEIVPKRTALAHASVTTGGGFSRKLIYKPRKGELVEFTSDDMNQLRIGLLNFQELLETLDSSEHDPQPDG